MPTSVFASKLSPPYDRPARPPCQRCPYHMSSWRQAGSPPCSECDRPRTHDDRDPASGRM